VLLVFLDGVGLGDADPAINPLAGDRLPVLRELLGGAGLLLESVAAGPLHASSASLAALDATLGVEGRPQSGTGQTALLTGLNAPARLGRHFGPWVPTSLRDLLRSESLFAHAGGGAGEVDVGFANAYPRGHMESGGRGVRRPGAFPLAAHAAGLLDRDEADLRRGAALASSITTEAWRRYVDPGAPDVPAAGAGRALASLSSAYDLTIFAHYDTDHAGHSNDLGRGVDAAVRVDSFLGGLLERLPGDTLLLATSDHGNLEDVRTGHTRAPVPLLAVGPGSRDVADHARAITDVAALIREVLGRTPRRGRVDVT
jgi:2,3-bisphosphoglycerate-independent phosphoglycerate mutase